MCLIKRKLIQLRMFVDLISVSLDRQMNGWIDRHPGVVRSHEKGINYPPLRQQLITFTFKLNVTGM